MTRSTSQHGRQGRPVGLAAAALLCAALGGCDFEPYAPMDMEFQLSQANRMALERAWGEDLAAGAGAQTEGALEMLVGTPQAPRFLLTEAMVDDGWDPNIPANPDVGTLSEETMEHVFEENRTRRFEDQIRLIEEGRFAAVPQPLYAADLWERWEEEFLPALLEGQADEPFDADDPEYGTWRERAVALFEEHYPTLRESAEMYRAQCLHCHGVSGGGDGPTGEFLDPRPRDYRLGKFKWIDVDRNQRPRRDDLLHILEYGVPRTAMPSFARFTRGELEGLIDYVRLLAIRGETEVLMASDIINSDYGDLPYDSAVSNYEVVWSKWLSGPETYRHPEGEVPRPEDMTAERLAHGKELFFSEVAACSTCHGENARGDGESSRETIEIEGPDGETVSIERKKLDEWGEYFETQKGERLTEEEASPYASNPRNLQLGNYRGGGRPVDLFRRVKYGISGTIMPAASTELSDDDLWDIVYYVRSIAAEHDPARIQERRAHGHDHDEEEGHEDHAGEAEGH